MDNKVLLTVGILIFGALTVLFDLNFVRRRLFRRRSVQARLRYGMVASLIVILLAALDIYLTVTA